MTGFALALLASLSWGVSDFLGGLKTRSVPLPLVLAISQVAGMVVLLVALLWHRQPVPVDGRLWACVGAGWASLAALGLLYYAMAQGSIAIVAPIAASGAVLPVLVGFASGDPIGWLGATGIVLALGGAIAAAWEPGRTTPSNGNRVLGALLALGSAVGIGLFFTLIEVGSRGDPYWATTLARSTACLTILGYLAVRRYPVAGALGPGGGLGTVLGVAAIGLTDALAEILFAVASTTGQLSIVAVLSSIYPVITVALALLVLRERMRLPQACAATSALFGVVLLGYVTGS